MVIERDLFLGNQDAAVGCRVFSFVLQGDGTGFPGVLGVNLNLAVKAQILLRKQERIPCPSAHFNRTATAA